MFCFFVCLLFFYFIYFFFKKTGRFSIFFLLFVLNEQIFLIFFATLGAGGGGGMGWGWGVGNYKLNHHQLFTLSGAICSQYYDLITVKISRQF